MGKPLNRMRLIDPLTFTPARRTGEQTVITQLVISKVNDRDDTLATPRPFCF